jgi:hypothetical protein
MEIMGTREIHTRLTFEISAITYGTHILILIFPPFFPTIPLNLNPLDLLLG